VTFKASAHHLNFHQLDDWIKLIRRKVRNGVVCGPCRAAEALQTKRKAFGSIAPHAPKQWRLVPIGNRSAAANGAQCLGDEGLVVLLVLECPLQCVDGRHYGVDVLDNLWVERAGRVLNLGLQSVPKGFQVGCRLAAL
jgi:hypothetical protein